MYTRPKNVGILLYIVAFFLLIRCAYIILYLVYPVHVEPWAVYILGYYLIFELVPTYLVYQTILMQIDAQKGTVVGQSTSEEEKTGSSLEDELV